MIWKIRAMAFVVSLSIVGFVAASAPAAANGSYHQRHHPGYWRSHDLHCCDGRRATIANEWNAPGADVPMIYVDGPVDYSGCREQYAQARDSWNNFIGYQLVWICN
jgi:hypothetical protein